MAIGNTLAALAKKGTSIATVITIIYKLFKTIQREVVSIAFVEFILTQL